MLALSVFAAVMNETGIMRLFGIIYILLMYESSTTLAILKDGYSVQASVCKNKNGGLLPILGTCKGYFICNDGKAVVGYCGAKSRFNPHKLRCDDADKVKCIYDDDVVSELDDDEESKYDTNLSISYESDEYESDESEEPITLRPIFRPSVIKKPAIQLQKLETNKTTKENSVHISMCRGRKSGFTLPKLGSCTEYYLCRHEKAQLHLCAEQMHFSVQRQICVEPAEAQCIYAATYKEPMERDEDMASKPAIISGFCTGEKQDAIVPHPDDCSKFMLCTNMMFLVMDCPNGLHFNAEKKRCDYAKLANCQVPASTAATKNKKKQKKNLRKHKEKKLFYKKDSTI